MQIKVHGASSSTAAAARAAFFFLSRLFALALALGDCDLGFFLASALGDAFVGLDCLCVESPPAEAGFALALTCKYSHLFPLSQVPA